MSNFLPISVTVFGGDYELFSRVVNRGIDARLEAFTKSKFTRNRNRAELHFHVDELQILLRRLLEEEDDEADSWVDSILETYWGISE